MDRGDADRDAQDDGRCRDRLASCDPPARRADRSGHAVLAPVPPPRADPAMAEFARDTGGRFDYRDAPDARQRREHGDAQRSRAPRPARGGGARRTAAARGDRAYEQDMRDTTYWLMEL